MKETLEEQIRPHTQYWDCYNDCPLEYNHTGKVMKIIKKFSIDFHNFIKDNYVEINGLYDKKDHAYWNFDGKTIEQLLDIFKDNVE